MDGVLKKEPVPVDIRDITLLKRIPFDNTPAEMRSKIFGVDYICIDLLGRGQLYVTRYGWPWMEHLLPEQWYENQQYYRIGQRLSEGGGAVYRVPTFNNKGSRMDLVVKFSRFAQDVMLYIKSDYPDSNAPEVFDNARFNGPFEEFGVLMELRNSKRGPSNLRIRTKRPFAIYCPHKEYELWQIGRTQWRFSPYQEAIQKNQVQMGCFDIKLDIKKQYILLFGWVKGESAVELYNRGLLDEHDLRTLTIRVHNKLKQKGFRVLDNKPRHFILRRHHRDNRLLRRNGKLVYTLVDFELLLQVKKKAI